MHYKAQPGLLQALSTGVWPVLLELRGIKLAHGDAALIARALPNLRGLTALMTGGWRLGAAPPVFPALESARLGASGSHDNPLAQAVVLAKMAPQLQRLCLGDCDYGRDFTHASCNLAGATRLTHVVLGAGFARCILHASVWGDLAALPALKELSVHCTQKELLLVSRLSALEALSAKVYYKRSCYPDISVANVPAVLAAAAALPRLRALRLDLVDCGRVELGALLDPPTCGALTALTLAFQPWGPSARDAAQLAARMGLRRLVMGPLHLAAWLAQDGNRRAFRRDMSQLAAEMAAEGLQLEVEMRERRCGTANRSSSTPHSALRV